MNTIFRSIFLNWKLAYLVVYHGKSLLSLKSIIQLPNLIFNFQFQFWILILNFNFHLQFLILIFVSDFQYQFSIWLSTFSFQFQFSMFKSKIFVFQFFFPNFQILSLFPIFFKIPNFFKLPISAQLKLQWNWAGFIPSFIPPARPPGRQPVKVLFSLNSASTSKAKLLVSMVSP